MCEDFQCYWGLIWLICKPPRQKTFITNAAVIMITPVFLFYRLHGSEPSFICPYHPFMNKNIRVFFLRIFIWFCRRSGEVTSSKVLLLQKVRIHLLQYHLRTQGGVYSSPAREPTRVTRSVISSVFKQLFFIVSKSKPLFTSQIAGCDPKIKMYTQM